MRDEDRVSCRTSLPRSMHGHHERLRRQDDHVRVGPDLRRHLRRQGQLQQHVGRRQQRYLEGDFHRLPDFDKLAPLARTKKQNVDAIDLKRVDSLLASQHIRMKKEHFAIRFDGLFRAPKAGVYHFVVRADDGVKLEIDREVVLEDDGEHVIRDADGSIALAEGAHTLRLSYFQGGEGNALDVKVEAADGSIPLQPIHDLVFSAPVK